MAALTTLIGALGLSLAQTEPDESKAGAGLSLRRTADGAAIAANRAQPECSYQPRGGSQDAPINWETVAP